MSDKEALRQRLASMDAETLALLTPAELEQIEEFLEEDAFNRDFLSFCRAADPKFEIYRHVEYIGEYLQAVADDEIDRLMICVGPRTGKSYLATRLFPAYYLYNNPDKFIMLTACSADLARNKFSVELRELMTNDPINLEMGPATGKDMWRTAKQGGVIAAGAGGTIIGMGADLLIIDDPFKNYEDAMSPAVQNKIFTWYTSVATNRLEPGGKVVIINQRFSDNDLSGRILDQNPDDWTILTLPAIAGEDDPMGREPGEAIVPERYTIQDLERKKREIGPTMFESVYQQNPIPVGGNLFNRSDARYFTRPDPYTVSLDGAPYELAQLPQFLACDLSQTTTAQSDHSVIAHLMATPQGDLVTLNVLRGRWKATETENKILSYAQRHENVQFAVIERSVGSIPTIEQVQKDMLVYDPPPRKEKAVRAIPLQILQERGMFWTPRPEDADWVTDMEHELYRFPLGRNDDIVDALAWGVDYLDKIKLGDPEFLTLQDNEHIQTVPSITERVHTRAGMEPKWESKLFTWMN